MVRRPAARSLTILDGGDEPARAIAKSLADDGEHDFEALRALERPCPFPPEDGFDFLHDVALRKDIFRMYLLRRDDKDYFVAPAAPRILFHRKAARFAWRNRWQP